MEVKPIGVIGAGTMGRGVYEYTEAGERKMPSR
jgi:3-hydroxyacyl-CoA dehydrogenase